MQSCESHHQYSHANSLNIDVIGHIDNIKKDYLINCRYCRQVSSRSHSRINMFIKSKYVLSYYLRIIYYK